MNTKNNLFILIGPTAIGKTQLSIALAKRMNGEIISADSMQIYKYMNIGSAKISYDEMQGVPHYLLDIIYPDEDFTVANFKEMANRYIIDINKYNKLPMVVGGTGLYINSLVYDLKFTKVAPDYNIRNRLENYSNEYLYKELEKIDKISYEKISINDRKRIIRALEIYEVTGKSMSEYNKDFRKPREDINLVMIGLSMDRSKLYNRINKRVDLMIEDGLIEEVKSLLSMGYTKDLVSMQGIGYKEIISYLHGEITLEESIELIKRGTRNYAKRQFTWFKRDDRIKWIDIDNYSSIEELVEYIVDYTQGKFKKYKEG